ncbi:MAG: cold shock domain-containing protein [Anaerolineae bacterium]|nr:cold shock domain-containing protein [Anaerolineae bacterium]
MTYRDEMKVCDNCGKKFVFRVEDQRRQAQMGFDVTAPDLCDDCRREQPAQPGLHPGIVKWYSNEKSFGFIIQSDGSEIFFHRSGVTGDPEKTLHDGSAVWYELQETDRGPQAYNVHERE